MDDHFQLYDLRVEVLATERPMVCSHRAGDWFEVQGENLRFPDGQGFSMYALAALLPIVRHRAGISAPLMPLEAKAADTADSCAGCPFGTSS